ncbi:MAG TPA: hypothetical protein VMT37_15110 [Solirubrobacterales bacterium]|nr:hypothetical protein [Solirubrobacterales bacterium]
MSEPRDVVLTNSVISFDGRVIELFGHSGRTGNRVHIALITSIEESEREILIKARGMVEYSIVLADLDEGVLAELQSLLAEVRRAAPSLQG